MIIPTTRRTNRIWRATSVLALAALLAMARSAADITVYLAGDSTMAPKLPEKRPETGWGEMLPRFLAPTVHVSNHAMNGRSTRTFIAEGRWQAILDSAHAGDFVFIQFGHNDEAADKPDRYTPPADYRNNLVRMVADVRARGASPILFTPVRRRKFDDAGQLVDTHGEYPDIVRAVAAEQGVPLVDMHRSTAELLSRYGRDSSAVLFLQVEAGESPNYPAGVHDNTHFRPRGATEVARLAAAGLRALHIAAVDRLLAADVSAAAPSPASR
jgi:lysophospholipase L1-like esterase